MKKKEKNTEKENDSFGNLLKGKKIPILVLDQRWHKLFPGGKKPVEVGELEKQLSALLKEQGKLVNEIKDLRNAKKKLLDAIVSNMNEKGGEKKKEKQKKLILETNERIQQESDRLMELPYEIKTVNEDLLVKGMHYCYELFQNQSQELEQLTEEIETMREELKEKVGYKVELEESLDSAYSLMHGLLGHEVMNLFDKKKGEIK